MGILQRLKEGGVYAYVRLAVLVLCGIVGGVLMGLASDDIMDWLIQTFSGEKAADNLNRTGSMVGLVAVGIFVGMFVGALVLNSLARMGEVWDKMHIGHKVNIFLGIFGGFIAALPFLMLFNALNINTLYVPFLVIGLTLGLASLCIYALQSMEEILPWTMSTTKPKRRGIKILDTNVIIDGRIYDVAKAGFLEGQLYVPNFVLEELQHIADDHNGLRRQRGRRGLEVLKHMQSEFTLEIGVYDKHATDSKEEVDSKIMRIAKAIGADIVTNDWNLNRVARLQDISVLNLNDLALALKPNVLPSEALELTISREGNQYGQGVGYLDDGTMVVVENGKSHMGETMDVTVTQVIQTERGKMIFAEVDVEEPMEINPKKRRSTP